MNIDKQIQDALNQENEQMKGILSIDDGLFTMLGQTYQSRMRFWIVYATALALIISIAFLYCGYQFYIATDVTDKVFWGVWFMVGLMMQIATKLWIFMEMNRQSILREIAHLEHRLTISLKSAN
ncbi:hypothetical protein PALB_13790 [Pseudoalteromonas luteoviolacea B = ATCC 29581]|nr:hypothetical protein PALB_13790 [Pseudoalteromonas luteoviolacea B = ATCC 29581]